MDCKGLLNLISVSLSDIGSAIDRDNREQAYEKLEIAREQLKTLRDKFDSPGLKIS